jgi:hypothetical protein
MSGRSRNRRRRNDTGILKRFLTVRWIAAAVGGTLVVLTIIAGAGSRTSTLRELVIETLADRLDSDVELKWFSVDTFPTVDIRGEGLVVRLRGRRDVPPLVQVRQFQITGGIFGLLSRPRRFRTVTVEGLEINIPPGGPDGDKRDKKAEAKPPDARSSSPIHIDTLNSNDAILRILRRNPGKPPREFPIHRLSMHQVGVTQRMPFEAELINPLPRGFIKTQGYFGPWSHDPDMTPVEGKYIFDKADLSTIKGIAGILTSTGTFTGQLGRIAVSGVTRTPDFRLDIADHALPLTTRFEAVVDGTNGDTFLNTVDAKLGESAILASGKVVDDTPGVKGRTVRLQVKVADGRIDDFLYLAVKSPRPALSGRIALTTDFLLPSGPADVVERLQLRGDFALSSAQFTDADVRSKLASMSAREGRSGRRRVARDFGVQRTLRTLQRLAVAAASQLPDAWRRGPSRRQLRITIRGARLRRHAAHGGDHLGGSRRGREIRAVENRRSPVQEKGSRHRPADQSAGDAQRPADQG